MSRLIIFIAVMLVLNQCRPAPESLSGKWIRESKDTTANIQSRKFGYCGDLELKKDRSFIIYGDTSMAKSTTPGWSACQEESGPWDLEQGNLLTLWLDNRTSNIYLRYRIIKQNSSELILRSVLSETDEYDLYFKRAN